MREPILDVRHHSFTRRLRGADPHQVEALLGEVAPACDELRDTLRQLERQLADARGEIERLLQGERTVIRLFASAEEHARMCLGSARREAARITAAADDRARQLVAGAEEERVRWTNELRSIEWKRDRVFTAIDEALTAAEPGPAAHPHAVASPLALASRLTVTEPVAVAAAAHAAAPVGAAPDPAASDEDTWSAEELSSVFDALPTRDARPVPEPSDDEAMPDPRVELSLAPSRRQWWRTARLGRVAAAAAVLIATAAMAIPAARGGRAPAAPKVAPHASTAPQQSSGVATPPAIQPAPPAAADRPAPSDPVVLRLTTLRECWVRVTVDGRAEEMTLEEGTELTRGGKERIQVRIGDASAATIEVNGQVLPPLGRRGQVVSRTFTAASPQREAAATDASEARTGA